MRVQILFVALFTVIAPIKSVPNVQDINSLASKLLHNYRKTTLPSSDFTKPFIVNIKASPIALGDLSEVEEELSSVVAFEMSWNDTSIRWNPEDHNNITNITLGLNEVWKPTLMLLNPNHRDSKGDLDVSSIGVSYSHLGETKLTSRVSLHTSCDLETTYFPFDAHACQINLYLSGNDAYGITVYPNREPEPFQGNGAWTLIGWTMRGSYDSTLSFCFTFERKPMFIMLNILLPLIVLALLTPLVFLMKPENSADRLAYSITMLLSISVYMTIISDHLPKNSEPMPLISILVFVWYILNALIVLVVLLTMKIYHINENRRVPECIYACVRLTRNNKWKSRCTRIRSDSESEDITPTQSDKDGKDNDNESSQEERLPLKQIDIEEDNKNDCRNESPGITWRDVSIAIDRWCLIVFYLIKFIVPAVFIAVMSSKREPKHYCF